MTRQLLARLKKVTHDKKPLPIIKHVTGSPIEKSKPKTRTTSPPKAKRARDEMPPSLAKNASMHKMPKGIDLTDCNTECDYLPYGKTRTICTLDCKDRQLGLANDWDNDGITKHPDLTRKSRFGRVVGVPDGFLKGIPPRKNNTGDEWAEENDLSGIKMSDPEETFDA